MAESRPLIITLAPESSDFIERCIASGRFASPQDVILEAIELLRTREDEVAGWTADVRRAVEIGVEARPDS
jgi:putative addiction module CopG family antidote